jgi:hypothetical protein
MSRTAARPLALLTALALALLLGACGDDGGDTPAAAPAETTTTEAEAEAEVFDPDAADDGDEGEDEDEGDVFDPSGGDAEDEDDDEGSSDSGGDAFETPADQDDFCTAAEAYVSLLEDDAFADAAATENTLDVGNDLLEDMAFALVDGPERDEVYEVIDPMLDLYEVGDDNGNDPDVVTSDPAFEAWNDAQDEHLTPLLTEHCD